MQGAHTCTRTCTHTVGGAYRRLHAPYACTLMYTHVHTQFRGCRLCQDPSRGQSWAGGSHWGTGGEVPSCGEDQMHGPHSLLHSSLSRTITFNARTQTGLVPQKSCKAVWVGVQIPPSPPPTATRGLNPNCSPYQPYDTGQVTSHLAVCASVSPSVKREY